MNNTVPQEPYTCNGLLPGFEVLPFRTLLSRGETRRGSSQKIHGSAIIVCNPRLRILFREDLTTENFTVMTFQTSDNSDISIISGYFKFSSNTEAHIAELQNIMDKLGTPMIIAADVNAHLSTRHCNTTDSKGETVDRWLTLNNLLLLNIQSGTYTFNGPRYSSNVDITACSNNLFDTLGAWSVYTDITNSDHAVISYELRDINTPQYKTRHARYCENRADWDHFSRSLGALLSDENVIPTHADTDTMAEALVKAIQAAAKEAIPISKVKEITKPPWWTEDLNTLRKKLRRTIRSKYITGTRTLTRDYTTTRNSYLKALRSAKRESWRKHCSTATNNVWGSLYAWKKKGSIPSTAIRALKKPDGIATKSVSQTVEFLLNSLIPNHETDPRNNPLPVFAQYDILPATEQELKTALWRTSPGKAPGMDRITTKMARRAWPLIKDFFLNLVNDCLRKGSFPNIWKNA